jgi:hypothetical protein
MSRLAYGPVVFVFFCLFLACAFELYCFFSFLFFFFSFRSGVSFFYASTVVRLRLKQ